MNLHKQDKKEEFVSLIETIYKPIFNELKDFEKVLTKAIKEDDMKPYTAVLMKYRQLSDKICDEYARQYVKEKRERSEQITT